MAGNFISTCVPFSEVSFHIRPLLQPSVAIRFDTDLNMAQFETTGIFDEIQALVSDKLQVVSYKWLSRNLLVSSNAAKRLLQEFVEKHGAGLEVVYSLAGWLKNDPSMYHIRLVSKPKLQEARKEFDENCSVQVYSVQACLPKDPAVLWNAEFVQAEELFRQPPTVDNCLRDNRFCGVSNSFVKRNAGETHSVTAVSQAKSAGVLAPSRNNSAHQSPTIPQPEQKKVQQLSSVILHSPNMVKDHGNGNQSAGFHEENGKSVEDKEKVPQLPANKKKGKNDKNSSGTGGALANMWGHAYTKSKGECASAKTSTALPNSADAQICASGKVEQESSDDDGQGFNIRRGNNGEAIRKRRVIFDYSDEEDEYKDAVSLASPDPPRKEVELHSKQKLSSSDLEKNKLMFGKEKEGKTNVKERKETEKETNQMLREEPVAALSKGINTQASSPEKNASNASAINTNVKDKVTDAAPKSPKRRKVLKTWIDERGREVTEVVWEGEETEAKPDYNTMKKVDTNSGSNAANRPSAVKKFPAVGSNALVNQVSKAGNKKTGNKDPKQGNILSFFKRV